MSPPGISSSTTSSSRTSGSSQSSGSSSSGSASDNSSSLSTNESTTEEKLTNTPTALETAVPTYTAGSDSNQSDTDNGSNDISNNAGNTYQTQIDASDRKFYSAQLNLQPANESKIEDTRDPEAVAKDIVEANTSTRNQRGGGSTTNINIQGTAADIVHIARTDDLAFSGSVYNAAQNIDGVDSSKLETAVDKELTQEHVADAKLLGSAEPVAITPEAAAASATVLLEAHTHTRSGGRGGNTSTVIDVNSLAYSIEKLSEERPSLAVASRLEVVSQLNADQASDLNRIISGNASIAENIEIALENPIDGGKGALKGIANGFSALGELFVKGSTMQAAAQQREAAGYSALFGNEELAEQQSQLGDELHEAALTEDFVPEFSIDNRAQQGGETIGFAVDIAMAGKGIITGGAKLLAKNADELAEIAVKQADELAAASDNVADDLLKLGDDLPTRIETVEAPPRADLNPDDIDRFSFNHETGRPNIAEGIGTARADAVLDGNIRMPETTDLGVDFYAGDVPISLKGPLINGTTGTDLQINSKMVEGLSKSVLKDVKLNSATDTIVVDTLNMSPIQRQQLKSNIEAGLEALDNSKTLIYLE